jgi:molybdopterin-guanine dinucleotide biosynthesis protein A
VSSCAGILLVGGASRRFGSPKALALVEGETLAVRGYRLLAEVCVQVVPVGKPADGLALPFEVHDDASEVRAPIVGVVAGLRLAAAEVCLVVPVDMPWLTPAFLRELLAAVERADVAVPPTGPLPAAFRASALPVLERRLAAGHLSLRGALEELVTRVVEAEPAILRNVNTPADLS